MMTTTSAEPRASLDHLVVLVDDLEAAGECFELLGFSVTPVSRHSMGSRNRCVMFGDRSYIELLDIAERQDGDSDFARLRERGQVLAGFALEAPQREIERLAELGVPIDATRSFSRPIELEGQSVALSFEVNHIPLEVTESHKVFFCRHLTPDRVWTAENTVHPNGVGALRSLRLAGVDSDFGAKLATILGGPGPVLRDGAGRTLHLSHEPGEAVVGLATRDLEALRRYLPRNERPEKGALSVRPLDGLRLTFQAL